MIIVINCQIEDFFTIAPKCFSFSDVKGEFTLNLVEKFFARTLRQVGHFNVEIQPQICFIAYVLNNKAEKSEKFSGKSNASIIAIQCDI